MKKTVRVFFFLRGDGGGRVWLAGQPGRKKGGKNSYHQTECKNGEQALMGGSSIPLSGRTRGRVRVRLWVVQVSLRGRSVLPALGLLPCGHAHWGSGSAWASWQLGFQQLPGARLCPPSLEKPPPDSHPLLLPF